jgi:hypothetical protein
LALLVGPSCLVRMHDFRVMDKRVKRQDEDPVPEDELLGFALAAPALGLGKCALILIGPFHGSTALLLESPTTPARPLDSIYVLTRAYRLRAQRGRIHAERLPRSPTACSSPQRWLLWDLVKPSLAGVYRYLRPDVRWSVIQCGGQYCRSGCDYVLCRACLILRFGRMMGEKSAFARYSVEIKRQQGDA